MDRQRDGIEQNSTGVSVTLRAAENRTTFHLFEPVPLELVFSTSRPSSYSIELDDTMNFAGQSDRFFIFPMESVIVPLSYWQVRGVICCGTDRHYLSAEPTILRRDLSDYYRFEKPGYYSFYYSTQRVFRGLGKKDDQRTSEVTLTSNVLTVTILPDDPDWDAHQLTTIIEALDDPTVKAKYKDALQALAKVRSEPAHYAYISNVISQTELVCAQRALNALDTEAAIRERIKRMTRTSKTDLDLARTLNQAPFRPDQLLASTTRPDLMVIYMRQYALEPGTVVDFALVNHWGWFLGQRDCPERYHLVSAAQSAKSSTSCAAKFDRDGRDMISTLQNALSKKRGEALDISSLTLKVLTAEAKSK